MKNYRTMIGLSAQLQYYEWESVCACACVWRWLKHKKFKDAEMKEGHKLHLHSCLSMFLLQLLWSKMVILAHPESKRRWEKRDMKEGKIKGWYTEKGT